MKSITTGIFVTAVSTFVSCVTFGQDVYTNDYAPQTTSIQTTQEIEGDAFKVGPVDINTQESDFGGYPVGSSLYYCTSNRMSELVYRTDKTSGKSLYSLLRASGGGKKWGFSKLAEELKKAHVGPLCSLPQTNKVIVTLDDIGSKSKEGNRYLKLYSAEVTEKGSLANYQELPINLAGYSNGHPTLSSDGKTLYFASDRPGGFGGVDLYRVSIGSDGSYGAVENLGKAVNTTGDEFFPWISKSGMLFFASNGHGGYGGLDVFVSYSNKTTWQDVTNLGKTLNTSSDDFAFVLLNDEKNGYFSSNRQGGKGNDDIYSFELTKSLKQNFYIQGLITEKQSGKSVSGVVVELMDEKGQVIDRVTTASDGSYTFKVEPNEQYSVNTHVANYYPSTQSITTESLEGGTTLTKNLEIDKDPHTSLYAQITDKATKEQLQGVTVRIVDKITGEVVGTFVTNEQGEIRTPISNKRLQEQLSYNVELQKPGYLTSVYTFNSSVKKEGEINIGEGSGVSMAKIEKGTDIGKLVDLEPIYFDYGKYLIRPDAAVELDKIVKVMNENPNMTIELGSHTDARGSAAVNMKLSDNRAKASASYIKARITNPERITGKGYGESKLLNKCKDGVKCSEEQHALNRRTEFVIKKM